MTRFWDLFVSSRNAGFPIVWSLRVAWSHRNGPNAAMRDAHAKYLSLKKAE